MKSQPNKECILKSTFHDEFPKSVRINKEKASARTASMGGSKLRSIGFITMRTCWFLCVRPFGSRRAALQKYWTQPCFPRNVDGSPSGRPSLNGKLWMPGERMTGPWPGTRGVLKTAPSSTPHPSPLTRLSQQSHPEVYVVLPVVGPFLPGASQPDDALTDDMEVEPWKSRRIPIVKADCHLIRSPHNATRPGSYETTGLRPNVPSALRRSRPKEDHAMAACETNAPAQE